MKNYLDLLRTVLETGTERPDRTGIGSKFISGATLKWDLSDGFPMITTRNTSFRIAFEETMMFLRGETDTTKLEAKGINIWKGNTSREFLDNAGLHHLPTGSLGTGYSHTWRNFGGDMLDPTSGIDQITGLLEGLQQDPTGRRHVVTAWNPMQLAGTPLPPCHLMHMYTVNPEKNTLNSCFIMRSNDLPFGLPFNTMGYAFLNMVFAKYLGYDPGELVYFGWDAHIYMNQMDMVKEQLEREPFPLPDLKINKELLTIDDIMNLQYDDIEIVDYESHPDIKSKPGMAI